MRQKLSPRVWNFNREKTHTAYHLMSLRCIARLWLHHIKHSRVQTGPRRKMQRTGICLPATQHPEAHIQDNGLALEQIPECPWVSPPKAWTWSHLKICGETWGSQCSNTPNPIRQLVDAGFTAVVPCQCILHTVVTFQFGFLIHLHLRNRSTYWLWREDRYHSCVCMLNNKLEVAAS